MLPLLLALSVTGFGKYNEVLSPGDTAPPWKDLLGVDGRRYALTDFHDRPFVLLVFTCNTCPAARDYHERLADFTARYRDQVAVVAINANTGRGDQYADMQQQAQQHAFPYPYLHDATQQTAKAYGATYTPEFFLLDRQRRVVYLGAFDDADHPERVKTRYVEQALRAVMAGEAVPRSETLARGCMIRYEKKRR